MLSVPRKSVSVKKFFKERGRMHDVTAANGAVKMFGV